MIVYQYKVEKNGVVTYDGLFDFVGNVFHSIEHGISSAIHKVGSIFHTPASVPTNSTHSTAVPAIKLGNQIGGGAFSVLENNSTGKFGDTSSLFSSLLGKPKKPATLKINNPVFNPKSWTASIFSKKTTQGNNAYSPSIKISNHTFNYKTFTPPIFPKPTNSTSVGKIFGNALKQFATTATQTLLTAGQLKLQQSIYKELGLLPKQPAVAYRPSQPAYQPQTYHPVYHQTEHTTYTPPPPPPTPTPTPTQSKPKPTQQHPAVVVVATPQQTQSAMFPKIPKEYLLIGGLLLLALLLKD